MKISKSMQATILVNGGATLTPIIINGKVSHFEFDNRKEGYAVSVKNKELRIKCGSNAYLPMVLVDSYIKYVREFLINSDNARLGFWLNDGYWYLDVSFTYHYIENAMDMAKLFQQKGFYSFKDGKTYCPLTLKEIK